MKTKELQQFVFDVLLIQMPQQFYYHNLVHTKNVLSAAVSLAEAEKINAEEIQLIRTAALLHDTGFIKTISLHEEESCRIACEILPDYEYDFLQVNTVCELIMATKIPQTPQSHAAEILCDADLFYLGTSNFVEYSNKLYLELKALNAVADCNEWNEIQVNFLAAHTYFTGTAKQKLTKIKAENLRRLKEKIG